MKNTAQAGNTSLYCLLLLSIVFVTTSAYEPVACELLTLSHRAQVQLQLSGLRTALIDYSGDLRRLPFSGNDPARPEAYAEAWQLMMTDEPEKNILISGKVSANTDGWEHLGMPSRHYSTRWRGPYLDLPGKSAFTDQWSNPIAYYCLDDGKFLRVFLHSAGEDGVYDLASPKLTSIAKTLTNRQNDSWSNFFKFSQKEMLDAHNSSYDGDDLLMEISRIPKNKLKPRNEKFS